MTAIPDLRVASFASVAEAERTLAAMTESLPAEFGSVVVASELTEKVIDLEVEAIEVEQAVAAGLPMQT